MRAVEKNPQLELLELAAKPRQIALQIPLVFELFGLRLALAQFHHHQEILQLPLRLDQGFDFLAQRIRLVNQFLRLLAVAPKIVRRHQGVQFRRALLRAGDVKETSASARAWFRPWPTGL